MDVITTSEALGALCSQLLHDPYVTIDTEFMREQTYWPELCLIQVAGAKAQAVIDPQAAGLDLQPFYDLLANEQVLKVFHAARQDIEIFFNRTGKVPKPIFDTQVAAMVCGFGDQVGYEAVVRKLAKAQIDKSSRFTDWSRRPLSEKQLDYALSDVTHLRTVYEKLKLELEASGRASWIEDEMDVLAAPATYVSEPENAWKRIKARLRSKKQLAVLMSVSAWREREARDKNVPRGRIVKDDVLAELAIQIPQTREALGNLRALGKGYATSRIGDGILEAVKLGLAMDPKTVPSPISEDDEVTDAQAAAAEVLKLALKILCEREGIAPKLVANGGEIEAIAIDDNADVPALKGWRRQIFGETALALKAGRALIGFRDGKAAIVFE